MRDERVGLFVDVDVLRVDTDGIFGLPPQRIHRIEFRRPFRQPEQSDAQLPRQHTRRRGRMAAIGVEKHHNATAAVMPADFLQKCLEVLRKLPLSHQEQSMTGSQIHASEHHASGIPAAEHHARRFTAQRPHRTQWREQQQVSLVLNQHDATLGQTRQDAANLAFFSLAPGPAPARSAAASTRSPADAGCVGRCRRNNPARDFCATGRAAGAPSSASRDN